jgi:hypothetical protein
LHLYLVQIRLCIKHIHYGHTFITKKLRHTHYSLKQRSYCYILPLMHKIIVTNQWITKNIKRQVCVNLNLFLLLLLLLLSLSLFVCFTEFNYFDSQKTPQITYSVTNDILFWTIYIFYIHPSNAIINRHLIIKSWWNMMNEEQSVNTDRTRVRNIFNHQNQGDRMRFIDFLN